ncbi:hypothetical protein METSCH_F01930 [Metschnikowia aff. pulcherrima]|uniref:Uncharacterized protein n=1 Tax=Metschnikowia aff. pulcherrima TaxID=2163413 RepID=A0A4P6XTW1_9ASCO|nr:hypothetical protein METSCH_F01930 [Metschnikowia aff. pulcherrima]
MVPPKKDAFSDLFNYAHGGSRKASPNPSLNDLPLKQPGQAHSKATSTDTWADLDILSPNLVLSPAISKPLTPVNSGVHGSGERLVSRANHVAEVDPFAVFEKDGITATQKATSQTNNDDIFDFLGLSSRNDGKGDILDSRETSAEDIDAPRLPQRPKNGTALLDDDFTDAFTNDTPEARQVPSPANELSPNLRHNREASESDERDHILAALISEGFPIGIANKAIDRVGPDLEKCTRLIVMSSVRPEQGKQSPKDLGGAFQDMSNDLYKKASWFLDKSKKTVIKNINNFQNQRVRRDGNDMPAWIANQHKYKGQAIERRAGGESYEDYGSDEENIDKDEIRRLVQAQRQKEIERQRQRLETMGRSSSSSSKSSLTSENFKAENLPSQRPNLDSSSSHTQGVANGIENVQSTTTSRGFKTHLAQLDASHNRPTLSNPLPSHTSEGNAKRDSASSSSTEVDLLGLESSANSLSRAQRFKQDLQKELSYVSPSRHRKAKPLASSRSPRPAVSGALDTFAQSDYETHKAKGAEAFSSGDYDNALNAYKKCLESLPQKHELRIVITANLALTAIKIGNFRLASQHCEDGLALVGDSFGDSDWYISEKHIKYWYVRLLARKAESLEMLENFSASLECYMFLITKLGVNDKKTMDAKRRINNIVNPPQEVSKPVSKPSPSAVPASTKNLDHVKKHHMREKLQEQQKFQLHDLVNDKVEQWSHGKEDNLRSLLMSLGDVLPLHLGFPFITSKKITINDLMLTKKVKVNYMKVISSIHPDKLGALQLEDQMICQAVFVTLNKAWDQFKIQNNIA